MPGYLLNGFKRALHRMGIRVVRCQQRWGIDLFDDILKLEPAFSPERIFDVGANVGAFAEACHRNWPSAEIHAFEPFPETFQALVRTSQALGKRNLVCNQVGLSAQEGELRMRIWNDPALNSFEQTISDCAHDGEFSVCTVLVTTLDGYCARNRLATIDLLKIDVEGHECAVLRGGKETIAKGRVKFIYTEFHKLKPEADQKGGHTTLLDLSDCLKPGGFHFVAVYTDGVHAHETIGTYNALWMRESFSAALT